MTLVQSASTIANFNFLIWLFIFVAFYVVCFIRYRKSLFASFFYSGLGILGFFTFLNILVAHLTLFGGAADNIGSFKSSVPIIYLAQFLFLFIAAYLAFTKSKYSKFWKGMTVLTSLFIFLFYFNLIFGAISLVIGGVTIFLAYKVAKELKRKYLTNQILSKKWGKAFALFIFAWSLVWVASFLYRSREITFDCALALSRDEFLEQTAQQLDENGKPVFEGTSSFIKTYVTRPAATYQQLEEKFGQSQHSETNFFNIRYSDKDTTYFYCPTPFFPIQHQNCLGYRVTVNNKNMVKAMQRRGLWCDSKSTLDLVMNPIKDPVYYFFWSADMWSFQIIPSENYDMLRNSFGLVFLYRPTESK